MTGNRPPEALVVRALPGWGDRAALTAVALAVLAFATLIGISARGWIGTPFPGFFVFGNGVVPSIGRPGWASGKTGDLYQAAVIAVDQAPVGDGAAVYRHVTERPPGSLVAYTTRHGDTTRTLTLPSRTFSRADYWALFGAYLATGVLYLALGLLAAWRFSATRLGQALLGVGGVGGLYALSAVGIYGSGASMHLHALMEACFPAAFVYLALVFPYEREALVRPGAALAVWLSIALAIPYLLLLDQPGAYSVLHGACETYLGIAGLGFTASLIVHAAVNPTTAQPLVRAATVGALLGLGVPAVVMTLSGLTGGRLPVNVMTTTAFLFPLCLSWGLVRDGLRRA